MTVYDDGMPPSSPTAGVEVELHPCLNAAMQQNGINVLRGVTIENRGTGELLDICLKVVAEPAFAEPLQLRLAGLAPGSQHHWSSPSLHVSPSYLATVRERVESLLHVEVTAGDETVAQETRKLAVLAYDQWGGLRSLPELLCAFVLPNHPAIVRWLHDAGALLEQWSGDSSLSGYQSRNRERVLRMAAAVFHAIQMSGITYVVPPKSFEDEGQKVRTPDRITEEKLATCLDLAVSASACLEQAGLHSLVVLVEGHALLSPV